MADFDGFYIFVMAVPSALLGLLLWAYRRRDDWKFGKTLRLVLWNAALTLFLATALFWGLETWYRFFVDTTDSFGVNKITQRWMERYWEKNNVKSRDNIDYSYPYASDARRVTFIGDSFTAGHGIKDVRNRFVNLIRERRSGWEVHSLAANGYETDNEMEMIRRMSEQGYRWDWVVLVYNFNDISPLVPQTDSIYRSVEAFEQELGWWSRNSYFLNTLAFRAYAGRHPEFGNYFDWVAESYFGPAWEQQSKQLYDLGLYLQQHGGKLLVVTFPLLTNRGADYKFHKVRQRMAEFWQKLQVPHLDLYGTYEGLTDEEIVVNAYDAHPNERAHTLAADAIEAFVAPFIERK